MRFQKVLGPAVVAAGFLLAIAAASATTLTSPPGTPYTGTFSASAGGMAFDHSFVTASCSGSSLSGQIQTHGTSVPVSIQISSLTFTGCNFPTTVLNFGTLHIHAGSNGNGTVTWSGAKIAIHSGLGTCVLTTNNTHIGTITRNAGFTPVLDLTATLPRTEGPVTCGSSWTWTGSYQVTTPTTLYVDGDIFSSSPLTSPAGAPYTGTIKAESEGATSLDGAFTSVTCSSSTAEGKVESHDSTSAGGNLASLTFGGCNYPVTVLKPGSLNISTGSGAVTSSGAEVSIHTSVGTCVFTTNATSIGTLTDTATTGGAATLDIGAAKIPRTGGNYLCGSSGAWTGSYKVTTPSTLYVD